MIDILRFKLGLHHNSIYPIIEIKKEVLDAASGSLRYELFPFPRNHQHCVCGFWALT